MELMIARATWCTYTASQHKYAKGECVQFN